MSIRYKIALLFVALVTLLFGIISISVYYFSAKERSTTFNNRLKNRALTTAQVYKIVADSSFNVLKRIDTSAVGSLYNKTILVIDNNNSVQYSFSDNRFDSLSSLKQIISNTKKDGLYFFTTENRKAVAYYDIPGNFTVVVAAYDADGHEYLNQLKNILWLSFISAVILSFFAGLYFATNLVQPIKKIIGEVDLISSNNLSQRIEIHKAGDELTRLAETFNNLLDRLNDSFAIQRRFISNASHELSTPLTSVSSQLEVALQKERTSAEYREVMESIYEDTKELQQLTRSLLDIAKTGSQGTIDLIEVRLDEVIFKVSADIQKQNKLYKVNFQFNSFPDEEKLLTVFGNPDLIYIAFKNVIENGCKYSENNQSNVNILFEPSAITVFVKSIGDVISEADIQNIFQPFFRTNNARKKEGFGLGLTLTRRILFLHKATITATSNKEKETVFTIQFPNITKNSSN